MNYFEKPLLKQVASAIGMCFLFANTCLAEDFNLNVPVDVKNLPPEVGSGFVRCYLKNANDLIVGGGQKNHFVLVNGSYKGTVSVKINTSIRSNNTQVKKWECSLKIMESLKLVCSDMMRPNGPIPRDPTKPCKDFVTGEIKPPIPKLKLRKNTLIKKQGG